MIWEAWTFKDELGECGLTNVLEKAKAFYDLENFEFEQVGGHDGGRNLVYVCKQNGEKKYVLRVSALGDRTMEDYEAETEFVHYLAEHGAPVADVIPSKKGKLVECLVSKSGVRNMANAECFVSLFAYAKGVLLSENGYHYREGAPITELFYNMGKAIGAIHRRSKQYQPTHKRQQYFDKYNMEYIGKVIPDAYAELKAAIADRLEKFKALPMDPESYGLVHFDFSDGNYHVDLSDGAITTFDFDNCIYCWYVFDLAHLWTHGVGWCMWIEDGEERLKYMKEKYFAVVLEGYRSETNLPESLLEKLTLFIDMVLIEGIVDEFECAAREGEEPDPEDIEDYVKCLVEDIPYAGVGVDL
jgi:Ser/Thr protein kinase RdoA (MazF antagonist)